MKYWIYDCIVIGRMTDGRVFISLPCVSSVRGNWQDYIIETIGL